MKEEGVAAEVSISTCPCNDIDYSVLVDEFVVYDENEGGYIRCMGFVEKCRLCGAVLHSYTDVDWDATEEDYRRYLEKRVREGAVFCPICGSLFDSESWLARHIEAFHKETILWEGGR